MSSRPAPGLRTFSAAAAALAAVIATFAYADPCGEPENDFIWWDGFSGNAVDGNVEALVVYEGDLVIGGDFKTVAGLTDTEAVARWTGTAWEAIGIPPGGRIHALAVYDGRLIAGGSFVGGPGGALAFWDGESWTVPKTGVPRGTAHALAVYDGRLVVGGDLDDVPSNLMTWDAADSTWAPLGDGPDDRVRALRVHGGDLLVGGAFTHVGALEANRVARWDGSAGSPTGTARRGNPWAPESTTSSSAWGTGWGSSTWAARSPAPGGPRRSALPAGPPSRPWSRSRS